MNNLDMNKQRNEIPTNKEADKKIIHKDFLNFQK